MNEDERQWLQPRLEKNMQHLKCCIEICFLSQNGIRSPYGAMTFTTNDIQQNDNEQTHIQQIASR